MQFSKLFFLGAALMLSACAKNVKEPFAIKGHDPRKIVLHLDRDLPTHGIVLPAGDYYPIGENQGASVFPREYFTIFMHLGSVPSLTGIRVDYDDIIAPMRVVSLGLGWYTRGPIAPGLVKVVPREDAWTTGGEQIRRQMQGSIQRSNAAGLNAAVQGALMSVPR